MRVLLMFDLPVLTSTNRRDYRKFKKFLITTGFYMLQESVYCKMVLNSTAANTVVKSVKDNAPQNGLVQTLIITEKQFSNMELISGEFETDVINNDQRVIDL